MKTKGIKAFLLSAVFAALIPFGAAFALAVPPAPALETPIVDQTGTLSSDQIATLSQQINNSRKSKDYQMGILVIPTLEGNPIEDYSVQVARAWGIGDATKDNGVLLLVAKNDYKLRIEVGRGLEGDLTDLESGRIIRYTISPQFKKGDYYSGISLGVQNIAAQVEGRPQADTSVAAASRSTNSSSGMGEFFFFLFIVGIQAFSWLMAIMARTKSWWLGGIVGGGIGLVFATFAAWSFWSIVGTAVLALFGFLLDWAVSRNFAQRVNSGENPSWWAGGPWIGGSGGGFGGGDSGGSFGGGDFGGGGASGDW